MAVQLARLCTWVSPWKISTTTVARSLESAHSREVLSVPRRYRRPQPCEDTRVCWRERLPLRAIPYRCPAVAAARTRSPVPQARSYGAEPTDFLRLPRREKVNRPKEIRTQNARQWGQISV